MIEIKGLKNIEAVETRISSINGEKGILTYRGYNIQELAEKSSFEETAYLIWHGKLPTQNELKELDKELKENRELSENIIHIIKKTAKNGNFMSILQTIILSLGVYDKEQNNLNKAIKLTAKIPTIITAISRTRKNLEIIAPKKDLTHAGNFLYMLKGEEASEFEEKVFDKCLILQAEHGLNASTFAARITSSTLSDMHSSIISAAGTLKGELHGGAAEKSIQMIQEIKEVENVESYLNQKLAKKEKIMGFGHRVYKIKDPRAVILDQCLLDLARKEPKTYEIAKKIETTMDKEFSGKGIYPNIDFYIACVYHYLKLENEIFTPIFASSRITGWTAHIIEQYQNNKIIRPRARYAGQKEKEYVLIDKR